MQSPAQFLKKGFADPALSGKTSRLTELLEEVYTATKRCSFLPVPANGGLLQQLVASQFHTEALFLHGGCTRKQRDSMVEQFQNETAVKTMILS
jgi:hypothetical protein